MIISHTHKFIFICNGKVASTSMESALAPYQEEPSLAFDARGLFVGKHMPAPILRSVLPTRVWDQYFKFVFVRNPWDWFISQYFFNRKVPKPRFRKLYLARPDKGARDVARYRSYRRELASERPLTGADVDQTAAHLGRVCRGMPSSPTMYQYYYAHDLEGAQIVDFVGRFEALERDFDYVAKKLGLDARLPVENSGSYSGAVLDASAVRRVSEIYEKDIAAFGYCPPAPFRCPA